MIAGDNIVTARIIVYDAGILTKGGISIKRPDFYKLTFKQLNNITSKLQVLVYAFLFNKLLS
jgi:hypothetical protein